MQILLPGHSLRVCASFANRRALRLWLCSRLLSALGPIRRFTAFIHGALRLPYPNSERMVAIQDVYPQG